ncbi:MAG: TolC family protein [Flavobacteriales bacterium]|nr:TolC family protein [Flavobacteriales bacterium]MDW8410522.1 TolC family protein [Flavobacteriales bacterium]
MASRPTSTTANRRMTVPQVANKLIRLWLFHLACLLIARPGHTQFSSTLSEKEFLELVQRYHPVSYQAAFTSETASQLANAARGHFDPVAAASWDNKRYDQKEYWRLLQTEIKAPLLFGPDLKAGYENADGLYLDSPHILPQAGLVYMGLSIPLARDLLTDERRTALRQAQNMRQMGVAEQEMLLNELFIQAVKAYWDWTYAYASLQLYRQFVELARVRFNAVKQGYFRGFFAAIDTVEALIVLQTRQISQQEAQQQYINATLHLSNFLWDEKGLPMLLPDTVRPAIRLDTLAVPIASDRERLRLLQLLQDHPELRHRRLKVRQLELEQRLRFNFLLPDIRLQYNFLAEPLGPNPMQWNFSPFHNNFKYGASFRMPLLLRTARGQYQAARLKTRISRYDVDIKELELRNKLNQALNDLAQTALQAAINTNMVVNYQKLNEAEIAKFNIGESSVFLLNQREIKLIETLLKSYELSAKGRKHLAELYYRAGRPWDNYVPLTK